MAKQEQDREDLLHEATALIERAEFRIAGTAESIFVGFRRNGSPSVYFGGELVYQFNDRNELRRAFAEGRLIKAEKGQLIWLERVREQADTTLVAHPFTAAEETTFLSHARERLSELHRSIEQQEVQLVGQVPPDAPVLRRILDWLAALPRPLLAARTANVSADR